MTHRRVVFVSVALALAQVRAGHAQATGSVAATVTVVDTRASDAALAVLRTAMSRKRRPTVRRQEAAMTVLVATRDRSESTDTSIPSRITIIHW